MSGRLATADVVVVGPASWNQLVQLDQLPEPVPHTVFARSHRYTVGGTSAGKALHLTELGRSTLLHTVLGSDAVGRRVQDALESAGVPLLVQTADGPTERHLNLMDPRGGRVSIYLDLPTTGAPVSQALVAALGRARAVVLDLSDRSLAVLPAARESGVPIWTDLHDYDGVASFHQPFAAAAQYVFLNADGVTDPLELMRRLVRDGARVAVCTLGADGAVAVDSDLAEHRVAAVPAARIVDTNGAGDGFLAGFLHATLDGSPVPQALQAGARQAARALGTPHLSPLLDAAL
ncbi:MAG TPA: PfkB family carbohydrate kinase [Angustibacter sp.]|nr:PfkB family carbohydrate kinase [Angustibacter sp.]